jgi:hypothetical protein
MPLYIQESVRFLPEAENARFTVKHAFFRG